MKTFKIIIEDIKRAFYNNKFRFIIAFLIITALVLTFTNYCNAIYSTTTKYGKLNFMDYIFCLLRGIEPVASERMKETQIPYVWIAIQFVCGFVTLDYIHNDKNGIGRDILIRSKSRFQWWISKCICNVVMVIGIYVIIVAVSAMAAGMNYQVAGGIHIDLVKAICELRNTYTSSSEMVIYILCMPLLFSICISFVQMAMTEFMGPVISLVIILSVDIISVFTNSKWLWGNWSMITRSNLCIDNGISVTWAVIASLSIATVAIIVGGYRFYRSDVL